MVTEHRGATQRIATSGPASQHDFEARLVHADTSTKGRLGELLLRDLFLSLDFNLKSATFCMKTEQHPGAIRGIATSGRVSQHYVEGLLAQPETDHPGLIRGIATSGPSSVTRLHLEVCNSLHGKRNTKGNSGNWYVGTRFSTRFQSSVGSPGNGASRPPEINVQGLIPDSSRRCPRAPDTSRK